MTQLSDETIKKLDEIIDHAYNAGVSVKERVKDEITCLIEQLIVEAEHAGERIALHNIQAMYYGSTFNDTTDWRAEYQQIIEIVDGRLAQLNPKGESNE